MADIIRITRNRLVDSATAEIAVALRDASPGHADAYYYQEAERLRDDIMLGTREIDHQDALSSAAQGVHPA